MITRVYSCDLCRRSPESPKHLCQICVKAVHEFYHAADAAGEILPDPIERGS